VKLCIHRYQNKGVQGLVMRSSSGLQRLTTIEEDMAIIVASKKTLFFSF
jgi:dihydrodipicolinate synthase/N-acetylneuraminate lyase